jgi:purine-cytosine permease-like protein
VQLLRHPLPSLTRGGFHDFWLGVDTVIAVAISYVPVASDYTRHARDVRGAFLSTFLGYSITQIACYLLGLITLVTVAHSDADKIFGSFIAVPLGAVAFAVLAAREVDQCFVDAYSTAVSVQNIRPRWDRRWIALVVGVLATVIGLGLDIRAYENFLVLLGSVFVPLLGVLIVDYYLVRRGRWDLGESSRLRWATLTPWVIGFVAYQLINPGYIEWWAAMWQHVDSALGFVPRSWMSASIFSFAVAAVVALPVGLFAERRAAAAR